jgi:RNA polymerase sigma factor (sigma-70 family)
MSELSAAATGRIATANAVEAVFRIEQARLIAGLTRMVRDVGLAEELAQDALLVALQRWPQSGIPERPGAWLMMTAKRRALDYFRRNKMAARKLDEIGHDLREAESTPPDYDTALDDEVGDDLLRLIFTSCHPAISPEARVALTLRLLGGLTTEEIARAFLVPEATVAQRIVRAKRSLAEAGLPFEVPDGLERMNRLASVLEVLYLIFNEGYAATSGPEWTRPTLCDEAMRLGRILAGLVPDEPEVHGLVGLMELQASRLAARRDPGGRPVLLLDQDRTRWNWLLIGRGLEALQRAESLGGSDGFYALQAGIAACHARATMADETDWRRIAGLYDRLLTVAPSPVIALNRAVAHSMAHGPEAGLALLMALDNEPALRGYAPLAAARGDFLARLERHEAAAEAFTAAAALTQNAQEQMLLLERARQSQAKQEA